MAALHLICKAEKKGCSFKDEHLQITGSMSVYFSERRGQGFSLVELMVVISIGVLISAMAIPSFMRMAEPTNLAAAGENCLGLLDLAKQKAVSQGRYTEFRLFRPDGQDNYTAIGITEIKSFKGEQETNLIGKIENLPKGIVIYNNDVYSELLKDLEEEASNFKVGGRDARYRCFRFRPNGTTDITNSVHVTNCFFTIVAENKIKKAGAKSSGGESMIPPNFVTIAIDKDTGQARKYRP